MLKYKECKCKSISDKECVSLNRKHAHNQVCTQEMLTESMLPRECAYCRACMTAEGILIMMVRECASERA